MYWGGRSLDFIEQDFLIWNDVKGLPVLEYQQLPCPRWNHGSWKRIHWSDESRFCLHAVDGRARVWRTRNTRLPLRNYLPKVSFSGTYLVNQHLANNAVTRIPWPAKPLDLNAIEHVWDIIGRKVERRNPLPQNLGELDAALREWQRIPMEQFRNLVWGMPRRFGSTY
ncbi:hypothetical protein SNE40_022063 [Patella caerulea]|uniref:Uncharacterized protein n=1 Tax=Patella caerulea TaxID=87958 RepID=A0AAN8GCF0_PATCE